MYYEVFVPLSGSRHQVLNVPLKVMPTSIKLLQCYP